MSRIRLACRIRRQITEIFARGSVAPAHRNPSRDYTSPRAPGRRSRPRHGGGTNRCSAQLRHWLYAVNCTEPATPQVYEDPVALKTRVSRACSVCLLVQLAAAGTGCSEFGFGRDKAVDPNLFPENYKKDVVAYVENHPAELLNARDATISAPALRQFGGESRYFVCLRADAPDGRKEKMVIFFSGRINQFIDAESNQCNAALHQPFPEFLAQLRELKPKN